MYSSVQNIREHLNKVLQNEQIINKTLLREEIIDQLIFTAVFSSDELIRQEARSSIKKLAFTCSLFPSSIFPFYQAFGKGEINGFTVPAINMRTLTYDMGILIFELMRQKNIGPVIFEIAKSEMDYTFQRPEEYSACVLAAAIKTGYRGPIFLQGDHFQISSKRFLEDPGKELSLIKNLIRESVACGFYNIDIDASTLVNLAKPTYDEQQTDNYHVTAQLTTFIRGIQPNAVTISIGGEIGHIGGKNSTVEEFQAFMEGYRKLIRTDGISKVSVQTGTSHGGIPLPDGSIAKVALDFSALEKIGKTAREQYQLGGVVQHGASTLPSDLFDRFPKVGTLEIHLATGFQNIVYDTLSQALRDEMYQWVKENCKNDLDTYNSMEQFLYKERKKALGPFKQKLWTLPESQKKPIFEKLRQELDLLFTKLNVLGTKDTLSRYIPFS